MMRFLTLLIAVHLSILANGQTNREHAFEKAALGILNLYNKKDTRDINKYIRQASGVFTLGTIGASNVYQLQKSICLDSSCAEQDLPAYVYYKAMREQRFKKLPQAIKTATKPVFNCETIYREGLFRMMQPSTILSKTIKDYIKHIARVPGRKMDAAEERRLNDQLKLAKKLEKDMRVMVFTTKQPSFWGGVFIYGMNYINGKWYLTMVDFLSADCSV